MGPGGPDSCHHSNRTSSAGRSRRETVCTIHSTSHPSGLSPHLSGIRPPRQLTNPLGPLEPLLMAQQWLEMSPVTSKAVRSVPSHPLHDIYQRANWFHCLSHTDSGPISEWTLHLPASNVDRFSKACKLIPLRGIPTAEALFHYVFQNVGIPEDIATDKGLQFISRVWHGFFLLLGISVSLSSGYHPQTNGQTECKIQEIGRYI